VRRRGTFLSLTFSKRKHPYQKSQSVVYTWKAGTEFNRISYYLNKHRVFFVFFQLGDYSFDQDFHGVLKNNKINTDYVHLTNGMSSGMAQITVTNKGERRLVDE
jgi:sugar/nucleoside kinase (ribokinase family)